MKTLGMGIAHGKIILIGEHAVVYGHPGIALPLMTKQVMVKVIPAEKDSLQASFYQGWLEELPPTLKFISSLINHIRTTLPVGPIHLEIDNHIPASAGLGSSAAISSAITQAIYDIVQSPLSPELRFEKTQFAEMIVHGSSSGIDALTTSQDHAWYFVKGKSPEPIHLRIPAYLLVANTGIQGSTKEAVSKVAKLFTQNLAQAHLESIGLMSLLMKEAIEKKELDDMARLMNQSHYHLQELGVSHPRLDEMVNATLSLGALGAKLTGGGLGGSMIALIDNGDLAKKIQMSMMACFTKEVWLMDLSQ